MSFANIMVTVDVNLQTFKKFIGFVLNFLKEHIHKILVEDWTFNIFIYIIIIVCLIDTYLSCWVLTRDYIEGSL